VQSVLSILLPRDLRDVEPGLMTTEPFVTYFRCESLSNILATFSECEISVVLPGKFGKISEDCFPKV